MNPGDEIVWPPGVIRPAEPSNPLAFRCEPSMLVMSDWMADLQRHYLRAMLYPWELPDRDPFPTFNWWPWMDRAAWWARHGRTEVPERLRGALDVLRCGVPERDDW